MPESTAKKHWDDIYNKSEVEKLGWHENIPQPSIDMVHTCQLPKDARILNVGAGASTLIDALVAEGYSNLIATDISQAALDKLKERLGEGLSRKVEWAVDDLINPLKLLQLEPVALWHDRAVLHFFTEEAERIAYFGLLRRLLKPGGFAIIATFSLDGSTMCSGLPVYRYSADMLQEALGPDFELLKWFNYSYVMPSGAERKYLYTLFKRKN